MTETDLNPRQLCRAVSGGGSHCALLVDHARPSPDYPHITIEGHQFEEQVKPAIEEPTEYGSIVLGRSDERAQRCRWVSPSLREPGWYSEHGEFVGGFQMLCLDKAMRAEVGKHRQFRLGIWGGMGPRARQAYEPQWLAEQEAEVAA